jgi:hypothetical protein
MDMTRLEGILGIRTSEWSDALEVELDQLLIGTCAAPCRQRRGKPLVSPFMLSMVLGYSLRVLRFDGSIEARNSRRRPPFSMVSSSRVPDLLNGRCNVNWGIAQQTAGVCEIVPWVFEFSSSLKLYAAAVSTMTNARLKLFAANSALIRCANLGKIHVAGDGCRRSRGPGASLA